MSGAIQVLLALGILVALATVLRSWSWWALIPLGLIAGLLLLSGIGLLLPERPASQRKATTAGRLAGRTYRTIDERSAASNPGAISLSLERLALFHPFLATGDAEAHPKDAALVGKLPRDLALTSLREHLEAGDCRGAMVVALQPGLLVVAAYNDDFDACVFLAATGDEARVLTDRHRLGIGSRLLTVNTFRPPRPDGSIQADLVVGERSAGTPWSGVWPLIADFLSDEEAPLAERRASITEDEWQRVEELSMAYHLPDRRIRSLTPLISGQEGRLVPL